MVRQHQTRNLEILRCAIAHRSSLVALAPRNDVYLLKSPVELLDHAPRHQAVPDEQNHECADRGGDETGALARAVVADGLADKRGEKRAGDAEYGGEDETARIVGARREQPREKAGEKPEKNYPDDPPHTRRPLGRAGLIFWGRAVSPSAAPPIRLP